MVFVLIFLGAYIGMALVVFIYLGLRVHRVSEYMRSGGVTENIIDHFYKDMGSSTMVSVIKGSLFLGTPLGLIGAILYYLIR